MKHLWEMAPGVSYGHVTGDVTSWRALELALDRLRVLWTLSC